MKNNLLAEGLERLSIQFSLKQLGQLETMVDEIMLFNPAYRLVSNTDRTEIIIRHVLDSASALAYFIQKGKTEIIDLGTGAGFPGLVLAVFLSSRITLCESMTRRVNFLKSLIVRMGLENVVVDPRSAEDIDAQFDIVTSRAFHPLSDCYPYMSALKKEGGCIALYKAGKDSIERELKDLRSTGYSPSSSIVELEVPFLEEKRNLLVLT